MRDANSTTTTDQLPPFNSMTTSFSRFPTANLPVTTPDPLGFFEAIALAGLEGQFVRIPVAVQRRHFGNAPFGKLAVKVENAVCRTIKAMNFGRDFDTQEAFWSQADRAWCSTTTAEILTTFPRA